jgi:hypothetical protein
LFESLVATTANPSKIEIIAVVDEDDKITIEECSSIKSIVKDFHCKFVFRQRSPHLNEDYINFAARQAMGKFIFVLNDDVIFKVPEWDIKANDKLENFLSDKPDRIVYGLSDDGMSNVRQNQKGMEYSGFPIISREAIQTLGYAMHPKFNSWSADIHLYPIYNSVGRVCNLRQEVCAYHNSHHTGMRERDHINDHVQSINNNGPGHQENISDINKLKAVTKQPMLSDQPTHNKVVTPLTRRLAVKKTVNGSSPSNVSSQYLRRVASLNRNRR